MDRWEGKVAVVTGASAGIGVAIVKDLVRAGLTVVGLARRAERVENIARELTNEKAKGKLYARNCDITKEEEVVSAFAWVKNTLGGVDVLVNNAGMARMIGLTDPGNTEALRSGLDTNVWGLLIATREAVNSMRERNVAGHVIHINSVLGHNVANIPLLNVYPATKFAVTALTETLRQELRNLNTQIKVTSVSPGYVKTDFIKVATGGAGVESFKDRLGLVPGDVSNAVLFVLGTPPHVQLAFRLVVTGMTRTSVLAEWQDSISVSVRIHVIPPVPKGTE